jgi:hypothetical protein
MEEISGIQRGKKITFGHSNCTSTYQGGQLDQGLTSNFLCVWRVGCFVERTYFILCFPLAKLLAHVHGKQFPIL